MRFLQVPASLFSSGRNFGACRNGGAHQSQFQRGSVASLSVKRALINSGCEVWIFVIPIGIDHLITADERPKPELAPAEGATFRFLHVSSVFDRKGPDVLLSAYLDAFVAQDAVELYIKTFPNPHNQIRSLLDTLSAERSDLPKVVIDESPLDDARDARVAAQCPCDGIAERGEGFNLPAAEAMAMGVPVLVTGAGGHADFCTQATATLLPFHFSASRSHLHAPDACWLEPDVDDLRNKLRSLRDQVMQRDAELISKLQTGIDHIRTVYTWDNSARAVLSCVDWLCHRSNKNSTVGSEAVLEMALVSPWATRCGIAEYSESLVGPMIESGAYKVTVYCDRRTSVSASDALPSWTGTDSASVVEVLLRIERSKCDIVFVQHQPSLFELNDAVCGQLASLRRQGKTVVVELHSTTPLLSDNRPSAYALGALAKLDRIVVHKIEDLNNLLALGLADNVLLQGLGVMQPLADPTEAKTRTALKIPANALVVACFGFALEHKGIDTLVECIEPLMRATKRPVHLLALNSIMDARSEQLIRRCRERSRELGVEGQIEWFTEYLPISECQQLLSAADYMVFPYKYTRESASAAVTVGLSDFKASSSKSAANLFRPNERDFQDARPYRCRYCGCGRCTRGPTGDSAIFACTSAAMACRSQLECSVRKTCFHHSHAAAGQMFAGIIVEATTFANKPVRFRKRSGVIK